MANQVAVTTAHPAAVARGRRLDRNTKFVFLIPTVAYLMLLGLFPLLFSLFMLFGKWKKGTITWVGLDNIDRLVHQDRFWNAVKLTIEYVALVGAAELFLGTIVALALQSAIRGTHWFRLLFTLPMLLPPIAVSYTWRMLFEYERGPINYFLSVVGLDKVKWLAGHHSAMIALVIVDVWQWTPFVALGVLAALESLPTELYEAAVVDGATIRSLLKDITFPLLAPYMVALISLRAIDAFKVIDTVYILTGGGPGTATELLTFHAYVKGFRNFDLGYTAAASWALVILMTFVFIVFLSVFRRQDREA
jgi:multiple sugar transport system permease protein